MKITLEEIEQLDNRINEINSIPFEEIQIFEKGVLLEIDKDILENIRFYGLTNFHILRDKLFEDN
jgi:hypothetical protein